MGYVCEGLIFFVASTHSLDEYFSMVQESF